MTEQELEGGPEDGLVDALTKAIEGQIDDAAVTHIVAMRLDAYMLVLVGLRETKIGEMSIKTPVWSTEISNHQAMALAQNLIFLCNIVPPCKEHGIEFAPKPGAEAGEVEPGKGNDDAPDEPLDVDEHPEYNAI